MKELDNMNTGIDEVIKNEELLPKNETVIEKEPQVMASTIQEPVETVLSESEPIVEKEIVEEETVVQEAALKESVVQEATVEKPVLQEAALQKAIVEETMLQEPSLQESEKADCEPIREYYYKEEVKKPIKKKKEWSKFIAACLIVSIAGGGSVGASYGFIKHAMNDQGSITQVPVVAQPTSTNLNSYAPVDIIKAVKPTVVSISTQTAGNAQYFGSFSVPYESSGVGSGVIFYSDETKVAIATNNHVIDGATSIYVTIEDETTIPAKIVGTKSEADLAVITVNWTDLNEAGIEEVSVATFGDSDALEVGDAVFAIGNAMGMGLSATDGMISMTEQVINIDGNNLSVVQTSAAINGGNSGGALVNTAGEVIGINTAKYNSSMAEGMGYAIPSNEIIPIIEELLLNGTQATPFVGITGTSITDENSALYRLPVGALIMEVIEGGPSDLAGIMVGDIITHFNGSTVMDMDALIGLVKETEVGEVVNVHVIRNGEEGHDFEMTIGDKNQ